MRAKIAQSFDWAIFGNLVGVRGFEPPTLYTPCRCATWLRYTPTESARLTGRKSNRMIWRAQLLFIRRCRLLLYCSAKMQLGPGRSFGIIAAPLGGHRWRTPNSGRSDVAGASFIDSIFCRGLPATAREGKGPGIAQGRDAVNPGVRGRCRAGQASRHHIDEGSGRETIQVAAQISQREQDERWMRHAMALAARAEG